MQETTGLFRDVYTTVDSAERLLLTLFAIGSMLFLALFAWLMYYLITDFLPALKDNNHINTETQRKLASTVEDTLKSNQATLNNIERSLEKIKEMEDDFKVVKSFIYGKEAKV